MSSRVYLSAKARKTIHHFDFDPFEIPHVHCGTRCCLLQHYATYLTCKTEHCFQRETNYVSDLITGTRCSKLHLRLDDIWHYITISLQIGINKQK